MRCNYGMLVFYVYKLENTPFLLFLFGLCNDTALFRRFGIVVVSTVTSYDSDDLMKAVVNRHWRIFSTGLNVRDI